MPMPTHIIAVGGLVINDYGQILLGVSKGRRTWEFFGGQVENGENLEQALLREIYEETGVIASVESLAGIYSNTKTYPNDPQYIAMGFQETIPTKLMLDFRCRYLSGTPQDSDETEHVGWFTQEQALARVTHEPIRTRLLHMLHPEPRPFYQSYETKPYVNQMERHI